jgi:hypothetical protein
MGNMMQSITIGKKTLALGPAGPPASPEEGLRLLQDFRQIEREDLRQEILAFIRETLRVQHEKEECDRANDNTDTLVTDANSSLGIALNAAMTFKSVQSQISVAREQIAQLKRLISEFKLPNSEMGVP